MKMLVHRTPSVEGPPFDLESLKLFMRVDHDIEDSLIEEMGRTAAAEIEKFAQIALLNQTIRITLFDPSLGNGLSLPIGPVALDHTPTVTIEGVSFTDFDFEGGIRPYLRWQSDWSFSTSSPARVVIEYEAGFGEAASSIPPDLMQALKDQTAMHYEGRGPDDIRATSPHMARIAARYRGVQL
jgi:uncharacterized phiE125 gp8 family phage protein